MTVSLGGVSIGGGGGGDPDGWEVIETVSWGTELSAVVIALPFDAYDEIQISGAWGAKVDNGRAVQATLSVDGGATYLTSYPVVWHRYLVGQAPLTGSAASATTLDMTGGNPVAINSLCRLSMFISTVNKAAISTPPNTMMTLFKSDAMFGENGSSTTNMNRIELTGTMAQPTKPTHIRIANAAGFATSRGLLKVIGRVTLP